jgi:hypothetical protein
VRLEAWCTSFCKPSPFSLLQIGPPIPVDTVLN